MFRFKTLDNDAFYKAIEEKDYVRLKTAVISSIRNNPAFLVAEGQKYTEARIAMDILYEQVPEMFSEYKVLEFEHPFDEHERENWDKEYFLRQTFLLGENFCFDRYKNLRKIGKEIDKRSNTNFQVPQEQEPMEEKEQVIKTNSQMVPQKAKPLMLLGVIILAVVVLVVIVAGIK